MVVRLVREVMVREMSSAMTKNARHFVHGRDAKYCVDHVCVSLCVPVCPQAFLKCHMARLYQIFVACLVVCVRGSWLDPALSTSSFVEDAMFSHNQSDHLSIGHILNVTQSVA